MANQTKNRRSNCVYALGCESSPNCAACKRFFHRKDQIENNPYVPTFHNAGADAASVMKSTVRHSRMR